MKVSELFDKLGLGRRYYLADGSGALGPGEANAWAYVWWFGGDIGQSDANIRTILGSLGWQVPW